MKRTIYILVFSAVCFAGAYITKASAQELPQPQTTEDAVRAEAQNITISRDEYLSILRRLEALEATTAHDTAADVRTKATPQVDATSGASIIHSAREQKPESEQPAAEKKVPKWIHNRLVVGGYGEITAKHCFYSNNYLRYGKTPEKYKGDHYGEFDLPHVVIYLGYDFGKGWSMATEIEFEHGGPEVAVEIEEEEGGEYESEVERGGEVALEQFWLQKRFNDYAILRAGMQVIPIGGLNAHHEPTEFFGVYRPEGEFTIIPSTWHEIALTFMGKTPFGLSYQAMFLPGLDSDSFNRKNWVKPGAGSPYEFKLANCFAGAVRLDYEGVQGLRLSLSGYMGNSFRNTLSMSSVEIDNSAYKNVRGTVSIGSFDFKYDDHNVILRGSAIYGHLGDAAAITQYNLGMRKGSVSSKQWVASDVIAAGIEAGYDFFSLNDKLRDKHKRFYVFGRYEYYDSMLRYDGKRNYSYAWCGRHRAAAGINYYPLKEIAVKAEFSYGILNKGLNAAGELVKLYNDEPAVAVGIVFAGMFRP